MRVTFALILSAAACGTEPEVPFLWDDAWRVWGDASCSYAERCVSGYDPADHDQCVAATAYDGCRDYGCQDDDVYPEGRRPDLELCRSEMAALPCGSSFAPDSCPRALVP